MKPFGTASDPGSGTGREPDGRHLVRCTYCRTDFDLFGAVWCSHRELHPSKICPRCLMCLCLHPFYKDPRHWTEAPPLFRRHGFRRLFVLYL